MTTGNKPVNTPSDLVGLKMRVPDIQIWLDMMAAFGANPTPVALSELYLALSQRLVDGQENPVPTIIASKFNEVQNYMSLTNHKFETHYVLVNENKWKSLTADQRKIIETAFVNARLVNNGEIEKQTTDGIAAFAASGKTIIRNPDRQAFADIISRMIQDDKYKHIQDLYNRIQAVK
jgi:TRAP-type C4-dicarboxylate transport system substrate-binding protein